MLVWGGKDSLKYCGKVKYVWWFENLKTDEGIGAVVLHLSGK